MPPNLQHSVIKDSSWPGVRNQKPTPKRLTYRNPITGFYHWTEVRLPWKSNLYQHDQKFQDEVEWPTPEGYAKRLKGQQMTSVPKIEEELIFIHLNKRITARRSHQQLVIQAIRKRSLDVQKIRPQRTAAWRKMQRIKQITSF